MFPSIIRTIFDSNNEYLKACYKQCKIDFKTLCCIHNREPIQIISRSFRRYIWIFVLICLTGNRFELSFQTKLILWKEISRWIWYSFLLWPLKRFSILLNLFKNCWGEKVKKGGGGPLPTFHKYICMYIYTLYNL